MTKRELLENYRDIVIEIETLERQSKFLNQFIGKTIPVTVDVLSGATVTSKAIETAINSIEVAAPVVEEEEVAEEAPAAAGTEYTASAKGYKSDVVVTVTVDAEGKITAITADVSGETPTFGGRCVTDEAFMNQFIGQTIPVTVDALSGATVTSKAILAAAEAALTAAGADVEALKVAEAADDEAETIEITTYGEYKSAKEAE